MAIRNKDHRKGNNLSVPKVQGQPPAAVPAVVVGRAQDTQSLHAVTSSGVVVFTSRGSGFNGLRSSPDSLSANGRSSCSKCTLSVRRASLAPLDHGRRSRGRNHPQITAGFTQPFCDGARVDLKEPLEFYPSRMERWLRRGLQNACKQSKEKPTDTTRLLSFYASVGF